MLGGLSIVNIALWLGKKALGYAEKRSSDSVEKLRIESGVDIAKVKSTVDLANISASVVKTGMAHKAFWVPWLIATVPLSLWFAWGVLDSMLWNGTILPDIAELPPQLKEYADIAWGNVFYVGGAVSSATVLARAITSHRKR